MPEYFKLQKTNNNVALYKDTCLLQICITWKKDNREMQPCANLVYTHIRPSAQDTHTCVAQQNLV